MIGNNDRKGINSTIVGKITIRKDILVKPNTYINFCIHDHNICNGITTIIVLRDKATEGYLYNPIKENSSSRSE